MTGTDTGVGKTLVAGGIAHILASKGLRVGVFKPIATGCRAQKGKLISEDAEFLAKCAKCFLGLSVINPISYLTPAAPIVSSMVEKRPIDYGRIESAYQYLCENSDVVIVEGIGGVRVPISDCVDVLDIMQDFGLAAVVVARPNLGTINHTILTIEGIRGAGLNLAGVVISGCKSDASIAEKTAPQIISKCGNVKILLSVPFDEESNVEKGTLGKTIIDSLAQYDWGKLVGLGF